MAIITPITIYRFFSKEEHANKMVNNGEIFFNVVTAFSKLEDERFRDQSEGLHLFKHVHRQENMIGVSHGYRKIIDAWAFCGTTSTASSAKKNHCVWIKNFHAFVTQIQEAANKKFGHEMPILFGPVSYNCRDSEPFSAAQHTPYFTKPKEKMSDLEFRIVIPPTKDIDEKDIQPFTLIIPRPKEVFEKVFILTTEMQAKAETTKNKGK